MRKGMAAASIATSCGLMLLLASSMSMVTKSDAEFFPKKVHVRIIVKLDAQVNIDCKSSDDDIGTMLVAPISYNLPNYGFSFRPNFFGGTLFTCTFQWLNNSARYFNIYDENRDKGHGTLWYWAVKEYGPCLMTHPPSGPYDLCYEWMYADQGK